jgi:hypothetical protein
MKRDAGWTVGIKEMSHRSDFTFPVLQYTWGTEDVFIGGYVNVWPTHMFIQVKSQREKEEDPVSSVSEALAIIAAELTEYIPPGIEEAFEAMIAIRNRGKIVDAKSAQKIYDEIRSKWIGLIPSSGQMVQ